MTSIFPDRQMAGGPQGIGGWLILPVIGLFLSPIGFAAAATLAHTPEMRASSPLAQLAFVVNLTAIPFAIYTIWLLLKRKTAFPRFMLGLMAIGVAGDILLYLADKDVGGDTILVEVIGSFISALIWSLYFLKSKRVANTFIW